MTTPNTSISSLGVGDINVELNYAANTARAFNDGIFRNLTGNQVRVVPNSPINISDLSNKTAFGGIISANSSNVTSYGTLSRTINLVANTDMYSPDVQWTANVVSGQEGALQVNGKQASYTLIGTPESNVSSNVQITATLSYGGHVIGTASKYISFQLNSLPALLTVTGNTTANSIVFQPTAASVSLTATANAPGSVISFTVVPNDAGVFVNGNTVILSSQATIAGTDNNRSYSVTTRVTFNNEVIATDTKSVSVRAFYAVPDVTLIVPATTNNVFSNTGTVTSSLTFVAEHFVSGANVQWSSSLVSGDTGTLTVAPDNTSANLHIEIPSETFGTKKSIYDVTAALYYANGSFITSKTQRVTLRTGAYGLTFNPASNVVAQGYVAQTASTSATASYLAGTLSWNVSLVSGSQISSANTIIPGSGSLTTTLARSANGTSESVVRINPVLTFDGLVMANVAGSNVSLTADVIPYTFDLVGPTSNTVLGDAPVVSTIETTAVHDVANGYVVWEKSVGTSNLASNTSAATLTYTNNTIGSETVTLTGTLYDASSRVIVSKNSVVTLRAMYPAITFVGANNVTSIGYGNQNAVATVNASARAGADTLVVSAIKLDGADLVFSTTGNNSVRNNTLTATQNSIGTKEGLYRLTANVTWFGVSNSATYDVKVSATRDATNFTLGGVGQTESAYNPPVTANATWTASHNVPGATVTWSYFVNTGSVSGVSVNNNTTYRLYITRTNPGTTSTSVTATATLKDSLGTTIGTLSNTVFFSAKVENPSLTLNGPSSNSVTNTFSATASVVLTPSVGSGLSGYTYQFSASAVTGSASFTSNSSAATLTASYDGAGQQTGTYDITCNLIYQSQVISSATRRVTVTATCPAPTLNFSASDSSVGSFNFPVTSAAYALASSTPAGAVVSWTWTHISGPAATSMYTEGPNKFVSAYARNEVGGGSSKYDLIATYRTPNGTLLGTRSGRVESYSERFNSMLQWNYDGPSSNTVSGFSDTLTSTVSLKASVNPALSGHSFRITPTFVAGNWSGSVSTSNNAGTASATISNSISAGNGTNQKTAQYDFYIDVVLNGQVIGGTLVQRTYHTINPGSVRAVGDINVNTRVWNGTATSSFTFSPNGNMTTSKGASVAWMTPSNSSEASNYEINFGGNWLNLGTARGMSISATGSGTIPNNQTATGTYTIRRVGGSVVGSGSYYLFAEAGAPV